MLFLNYGDFSDQYENFFHRIIEQVEDFDQVDNDGNTLIFYAIRGGAIDFIEPLLERMKLPIDTRNKNGINALDFAYQIVQEGSLNPELYKEISRKLFELGASTEKIYQARFQDLDKVIFFDDIKAFNKIGMEDLDIMNLDLERLFKLSIKNSSFKILKELLKNKAIDDLELSFINQHDLSNMFSTKAEVDDETINLLVEKLKFDPNWFDVKGSKNSTLYPDKSPFRSAVVKAASARNFNNFLKLSEIGGDYVKWHEENSKDSPLLMAASLKNSKIENYVYGQMFN
ncbi:MAG: hypothetical protein HRT47_10575 [Candidatus Caenarcaniphilales bacterium]|nr:hypothetical protein [Candidatus Caenarcaniphilales bacterium]